MRSASSQISSAFALAVIIAIFSCGSSAFAFNDKEGMEEAISPAENEMHLGTRHRPDMHLMQEFFVFGGNYLGDEWRNTWDAGGGYSLYFTHTYGLGFEYVYSPLMYDSDSEFGRSLTTKNTNTVVAFALFNNECSFLAGKTVIECDLYGNVGGGTMQINKEWQPTAAIGGGIRIYTPLRWLAAKVEVMSFLHPTPKPTGDAFNADIAMNLVLSFILEANTKYKHAR
jgi:hypothetical protein